MRQREGVCRHHYAHQRALTRIVGWLWPFLPYQWPTDFPDFPERGRKAPSARINIHSSQRSPRRHPQVGWRHRVRRFFAWLCATPEYQIPRTSQPVSHLQRAQQRLDWRHRVRRFLAWLCATPEYQWPTDFPEYARLDLEGGRQGTSGFPTPRWRLALRITVRTASVWLWGAADYRWATDFPAYSSRYAKLQRAKQRGSGRHRPQLFAKALQRFWQRLGPVMVYQWPGDFPHYHSGATPSRHGWRTTMRRLADWLGARHAYRWPTAYPDYSTLYRPGKSNPGNYAIGQRRQPAWQRALRKSFDWLCTPSPYRWSTDFPQFSNSVLSAREPQRSGRWKRTRLRFRRAWRATVQGPAETLAGAWKSLVQQFIGRLRGPTARFAGGLLSLLLLLPVPAFAFTWVGPPWLTTSRSGPINQSTDLSGNLDITIPSGKPDSSITVTRTLKVTAASEDIKVVDDYFQTFDKKAGYTINVTIGNQTLIGNQFFVGQTLPPAPTGSGTFGPGTYLVTVSISYVSQNGSWSSSPTGFSPQQIVSVSN